MLEFVELCRCLEESRCMRHTYLDAWPGQLDLSNIYQSDYPGAKPCNAIQRFAPGLVHDHDHLDQIAEILRQSHT